MKDEHIKNEIDEYINNKEKGKEFYPSKFAKGAFTVHDVVEYVENKDNIQKVHKLLCPTCKDELATADKLAGIISKEFTCDDCNISLNPDWRDIIVTYKIQG
jgi:hypothetical protein